MKIIQIKALKTSVAGLALVAAMTAVLAGCAAPKQGPMFYSTANAIRAAETAGAVELAPAQYAKAAATFKKAEIMQQKRRTDRAQKLLELATAQASLARATSEAARAESSLGYLLTGPAR